MNFPDLPTRRYPQTSFWQKFAIATYVVSVVSIFFWLVLTDRSWASLQLSLFRTGFVSLTVAGLLLMGAGSGVTSSEVIPASLKRSARDINRRLEAATWPTVIAVAGLLLMVVSGFLQ